MSVGKSALGYETARVLAGIDFTNCYTDYGYWPWALFLPAAAIVLYFNRPIGDFIARNFTGPVHGQPGYDDMAAARDSSAWRGFVRFGVVFLSGGFLVLGVLAITGLLPCD